MSTDSVTRAMPCSGCPFALTAESEALQNLGCLPSVADIVRMKRESGHSWACHDDETRACRGLAEFCAENALDLDVAAGGLISYQTWYHRGEAAALEEAPARRGL